MESQRRIHQLSVGKADKLSERRRGGEETLSTLRYADRASRVAGVDRVHVAPPRAPTAEDLAALERALDEAKRKNAFLAQGGPDATAHLKCFCALRARLVAAADAAHAAHAAATVDAANSSDAAHALEECRAALAKATTDAQRAQKDVKRARDAARHLAGELKSLTRDASEKEAENKTAAEKEKRARHYRLIIVELCLKRQPNHGWMSLPEIRASVKLDVRAAQLLTLEQRLYEASNLNHKLERRLKRADGARKELKELKAKQDATRPATRQDIEYGDTPATRSPCPPSTDSPPAAPETMTVAELSLIHI